MFLLLILSSSWFLISDFLCSSYYFTYFIIIYIYVCHLIYLPIISPTAFTLLAHPHTHTVLLGWCTHQNDTFTIRIFRGFVRQAWLVANYSHFIRHVQFVLIRLRFPKSVSIKVIGCRVCITHSPHVPCCTKFSSRYSRFTHQVSQTRLISGTTDGMFVKCACSCLVDKCFQIAIIVKSGRGPTYYSIP